MPRIFLSYNRADGKAGLVDAFVEELVDEIARAEGWPEDDIFYVDVQAAPGVDWHKKIVDALRECDVFMPLLSPRYFTREYCGKEWGLFERRLARHQTLYGRRPEAIVPVLWEGLPDRLVVPDFVSRLQWFGPDGGLRRMVQQSGRYKDDLVAHTVDLAARLVGAAVKQKPAPADEDWGEFADAENVFDRAPAAPTATTGEDAGGTRDLGRWEGVNFVVAAATANEIKGIRSTASRYRNKSIEWQPYGTSLVREAGRIAYDRELTAIPCGIGGDLPELMKRAKRDHELVILLVDPWTLELEAYGPLISSYDSMRSLHTGVLVVWDADADTTARRSRLEAKVSTAFEFDKVMYERKNVLTYSDSAGSPSQFAAELQKVIAYIESLLMAEPGSEVRKATPFDSAESNGAQSLPIVDGPGRAEP